MVDGFKLKPYQKRQWPSARRIMLHIKERWSRKIFLITPWSGVRMGGPMRAPLPLYAQSPGGLLGGGAYQNGSPFMTTSTLASRPRFGAAPPNPFGHVGRGVTARGRQPRGGIPPFWGLCRLVVLWGVPPPWVWVH